jgi:hypothetical protein
MQRQKAEYGHEVEIQELKKSHRAEIRQLKEAHTAEIQQLKRQQEDQEASHREVTSRALGIVAKASGMVRVDALNIHNTNPSQK